MIKTLIIPTTLIAALVAMSCFPSLDTGIGDNNKEAEIAGTVSYVAITGFAGSSVLVNPSSSIIPRDATVKYSIAPILPEGLTFDSDTGEIDGTPVAEFTSTNYVVVVSGTEKYVSKIESDPFSLSIDPALSNEMDISNSSIRYGDITGTVGVRMGVSPSTSIVPSAVAVDYAIAPDLPGGLSFDSKTGRISGIPVIETASADYVVTVSAARGYTGSITSDSFTIAIVDEKNISGFIVRYTDISGGVGNPLSARPISDIPSDATVKYSIDPLFLPEGLLFASATGVISGIPELEFSSSNYTVRAVGTEDYVGMVLSRSFVISILNPEAIDISGHSISYAPLFTSVDAGQALSIIPVVNTIPAEATVVYSIVPALPDGLSFDSDGTISGIPSEVFALVDDFQVTVNGTDDYTGTVKSNRFAMEINYILITGYSISYDASSTNVGFSVSIAPTMNTIPPEATVVYFIDPALPQELMLASDTGVISGTPIGLSSAAYRVTVRGTDNYKGSIQSNVFSLTVTR